MKKARKKARRWIALAVAAALLISAAGAGVSALGLSPERQITLGLEPSCPVSEPLVAGEDVLRVDVTAQADFGVYSNSTVIYYDKRYFAPCDADGTAFTGTVQGTGIEGYLEELNGSHPLCAARAEYFGSVNLPSVTDYESIVLTIPYDLENRPAAGMPDAETPWFTFCLKVIAGTTGTPASIIMDANDLRTQDNRNALMYYSAAPGGSGWADVDVTLPAQLDYIIQEKATDPVRVDFPEPPAGTRGSLTGDITYVRNIESGTLLGDQIALRWPETVPDTGYQLTGWAYADDPTNVLPPESTLLEGDASLVPVFGPRPVKVQPYLLDMYGSVETDIGPPLEIFVNSDYSLDVAALEAAIEAAAGVIDTQGGWFLEKFGPAQANNNYIVPEMDFEPGDIWAVEIARVHRGTWFINYLPGGVDVETATMPGRTEKPRESAAQVAAAPWRKGWAFQHWTDGTNIYAPGQAYNENADITLTAIWSKNPAPSVQGGTSRSLQYKSGTTLYLTTKAPGSVTWTSDNPGVVSVNKTTGQITGLKRGSATITGTDGDGIPASVRVTVDYVWWQWLIIIFLFGWIWY